MFSPLRQIFRPKATETPQPAVPPGTRYYVIGDIHGRLDLFEALIAAVEADDAARSEARTVMVLLGDLVDRGPDSAGVVARARAWQQARKVVLLAGNHEEMFLESFDDPVMLRHFLRHGGRHTVLSYGVPPERYDAATFDELRALMAAAVPAEDLHFLASGRDYHVAGDYLMVHAGIAPDVALEEQQPHHLRWIREPFLDYDLPHERFVIHGHTITETVDEQSNRMGIDTGAYRSGRLTALALEGTERRVIQAVECDGHISIETGAEVG